MTRVNASPATYGVLGMLATRSWTGYELTQQVRRSLRFVWPVSEGHLYREQGRLVELGWATVTEEAAGKRSRKRYAITDAGRTALADWLATPPEEPHLQVEGVLRAFYADRGTVADLEASLRATADSARVMLEEMVAIATEYLDDEGPLALLESGQGGPGDRRDFHGRPMYPERLHAVALAIDGTTRLLGELDRFFSEAADEVATWPSPVDPSLTPATRARLEAVRGRHQPG